MPPLCPEHNVTTEYRRLGNSSIPWQDNEVLINESPNAWSPVVDCAGCGDHLNASLCDQIALRPVGHRTGRPVPTIYNPDLAQGIFRVNSDFRCCMQRCQNPTLRPAYQPSKSPGVLQEQRRRTTSRQVPNGEIHASPCRNTWMIGGMEPPLVTEPSTIG